MPKTCEFRKRALGVPELKHFEQEPADPRTWFVSVAVWQILEMPPIGKNVCVQPAPPLNWYADIPNAYSTHFGPASLGDPGHPRSEATKDVALLARRLCSCQAEFRFPHRFSS